MSIQQHCIRLSSLILASICITLSPSIHARLIINEVFYQSSVECEKTEFIELYNAGDTTIDLYGWRITGGIKYEFPQNTQIDPGGYIVVAQVPNEFHSVHGVSAFGPWLGKLDNEGEEIAKSDEFGNVIDRIEYHTSFPWPIDAAGGGSSMSLVNPELENAKGSAWRSGMPTPGNQNSVFLVNAPPGISQVRHVPAEPVSNEVVVVSARIWDAEGVDLVNLHYQQISPGHYIPAFLPHSTSVLMQNRCLL